MTSVIGVMSGTSLDGIDICHVLIDNQTFNVQNYAEFDYLPEVKQKVILGIKGDLALSQLTSLDYELGYEYARVLKKALVQFGLTASDVDVIANHGQTIYHNDNKSGTVNSTMQLGCGDIIKEQLQIDVVSNFRAADIAVGNKGAPLVQIFDQYLINQFELPTCSFLNIGGIANIYISSKKFAFDTGPGNMMINYAVQKLYGYEYDNNGQIAKQGQVNQQLLDTLLNHEYFKQDVQLSTGREDFGDDYCQMILDQFKFVTNEDIITTLTKFTADSITNQFLKYTTDENQMIYVSGGGAYNQTLMKFLNANFENTKVEPIDNIGIGANLKEAAAFAYFGYANYNQIKLKTLNGRETILGVLHRKG